MLTKKIIPWFIHLYTASGAILAFLTLKAALEGNLTHAMVLVFITMIIDGTDGMLARYFAVKKHVPSFDGTTLDNITDYLTYVFVPVVLLYTTQKVPDTFLGIATLSLILVSSSYQFCQTNAKSKDHFFIGFPDYWNIIVFYAIMLNFNTSVLGIILLTCAILSFIPTKYIYPSRTRQFRHITLPFTMTWFILCIIALYTKDPALQTTILQISFIYPVYYIIASLYLNVKQR